MTEEKEKYLCERCKGKMYHELRVGNTLICMTCLLKILEENELRMAEQDKEIERLKTMIQEQRQKFFEALSRYKKNAEEIDKRLKEEKKSV